MHKNVKRTTSLFMMIGIGLLCACAQQPEPTVLSTAQLRARILENKAPLLVVHLWATWCDPCREEFPVVSTICNEFHSKGVAVMLLSADDPQDQETVRTFVAQYPCKAEHVIAEQLDQDFMQMLSSDWSGALPATFLFSGGTLLDQWEGAKTGAFYRQRINQQLNRDKQEAQE